jgi:predicted dehydrogenase
LKETNLRAGIVGVGRLGRHHVRVLAGLPGIHLAGVYDRHAERGQAEAQKYGASQLGSLDELIAACDLVSIVTPTSTHGEIATRALEAGRACFVEKPICARVDEAEALVALARRKGLPLGVGQIERYNPAVIELHKTPLRPRFIEAHRLAQFTPRGTDVAVIYDLMIHDIDLLLHLLGEEPTDIRAAGAAVVSDELDICNARLEFACGAVANLTASRISSFSMRRFRIFAEARYVALDLKDKTIEQYRLFDSEDALAEAGARGTRLPFGDRGQMLAVDRARPQDAEMLELELADFVAAVRRGESPPVDGDAGLRALRVAERVHRQAQALLKQANLV